MRLIIVLFALLFQTNAIAQIDTTDWYPLNIGDKWEYYGQSVGYSQVEVIGDTLMPNGKTYFILTLYDRKYQRVDNNRYVMVYNDYAENNEYIQFDIKNNAGEVFIKSGENTFGYGIFATGIDNDNLLQQNLEWKEFREVFIDTAVVPPDTLWNEVVDAYWPRITKGLGVTSYAYEFTKLVGAVINGVAYGTLVNVNEIENVSNHFKLYQNYPNPFNPSTTIKYSVPAVVNENFHSLQLAIYDILGREIKTLVNKIQSPGNYEATFDASDLPSGIYYYRLKAGDFIETRKMILMK